MKHAALALVSVLILGATAGAPDVVPRLRGGVDDVRIVAPLAPRLKGDSASEGDSHSLGDGNHNAEAEVAAVPRLKGTLPLPSLRSDQEADADKIKGGKNRPGKKPGKKPKKPKGPKGPKGPKAPKPKGPKGPKGPNTKPNKKTRNGRGGGGSGGSCGTCPAGDTEAVCGMDCVSYPCRAWATCAGGGVKSTGSCSKAGCSTDEEEMASSADEEEEGSVVASSAEEGDAAAEEEGSERGSADEGGEESEDVSADEAHVEAEDGAAAEVA